MARGQAVWFNGKIIPLEQAQISLFTHGLHYGVGAFEGIRAYRQSSGKGAVFRLREHLGRFLETCKILELVLPWDLNALTQATLDTCRSSQFEECYIRPIAFTGDSGSLGIYPGEKPVIDVAILCWEWGSYLGDAGKNQGVRLMTSTFIRPHVNSIMTKGKITGQYVTGVLAKREAIRLGFDEALLVDPEGYLTEGTGENLFLVKEGKIKTTPLTSILNGITRNTVIEVFSREGKPVELARFTRDELWCADEVFLSGTAAEITPVRELDGRIIGSGGPGPLTLKLQNDFHALVRGQGPEWSRSWLTPLR